MKSRSHELLEKSIAAMISAIEIYNKPDFLYREETFSVLAINAWELLLKAKWLKENSNKISSLYVYEPRLKKDGTKSKKQAVKQTRSGNPFTHSLDYLAKKLIEKSILDNIVWLNIQALLEIRDSSVHFYNRPGLFSIRLQEVGSATLKNYVLLISDWFSKDLSAYNFYLMPLSFMTIKSNTDCVVLNKEEKNFISYVESLENAQTEDEDRFSVTVNIDIKFTRSKAKDALSVRVTKDLNATPIRLTEEQIRESFPWDYDDLTRECRKRYKNFKVVTKYHDLRKKFLAEQKLCTTRKLDPDNPKSPKKDFFSPNILDEFDKHYQRV
jgi:Protein of unknown function (DUF3644)/EC042_2821-lke REase